MCIIYLQVLTFLSFRLCRECLRIIFSSIWQFSTWELVELRSFTVVARWQPLLQVVLRYCKRWKNHMLSYAIIPSDIHHRNFFAIRFTPDLNFDHLFKNSGLVRVVVGLIMLFRTLKSPSILQTLQFIEPLTIRISHKWYGAQRVNVRNRIKIPNLNWPLAMQFIRQLDFQWELLTLRKHHRIKDGPSYKMPHWLLLVTGKFNYIEHVELNINYHVEYPLILIRRVTKYFI